MSTAAQQSDRCLRRDAAANRRRILDAARDAFARDGIDVSLIEIARRAGVGNATLHRNFNKESLVHALYEEWRSKRYTDAVQALADPDPWHGLRTFMVDTLEDASRNRTLIDVFMIRLHRDAAADNPVARLMGRAQESGDLRADASLEDLFLIFWGIGRTIGITGSDAPDQLHRQVAIALEGLRARPGQAPLPGGAVSKRRLDELIGEWAQATLVRRRC
jgi:AcrR family transcriptional regulator